VNAAAREQAPVPVSLHAEELESLDALNADQPLVPPALPPCGLVITLPLVLT
jgi:hypothetical protein